MDKASPGSGSFSSLRAYGRALAQTPRRMARRACAATASGEEMSRVRARSGPRMARALRWWDLVGLGLGGMVGAGVFVTTGRATSLYAGPGVVVSFAIAGLCALLSAFCYTEFAVDMPVAGGAFSYLRVTFGEPRHAPSASWRFFSGLHTSGVISILFVWCGERCDLTQSGKGCRIFFSEIFGATLPQLLATHFVAFIFSIL
jgi:amino acid transporter